MGRVKIGDNAVIGTLTLVNKDIPENTIVTDITAEVKRFKTTDEIKKWNTFLMIK